MTSRNQAPARALVPEDAVRQAAPVAGHSAAPMGTGGDVGALMTVNDDLMTINYGPQHPSSHGLLRLELDLDGETVVAVRPHIGYLHTGIEKTIEDKRYEAAITCTDRMDYLNPLGNNLGYCMAVEKILGITPEIPQRAQVLRVLLAELTRLASHLICIGATAMELGAMSVFLYCLREREQILELFEWASGQRMMTSYIRIGGIEQPPPTAGMTACVASSGRCRRASTSTSVC